MELDDGVVIVANVKWEKRKHLMGKSSDSLGGVAGWHLGVLRLGE